MVPAFVLSPAGNYYSEGQSSLSWLYFHYPRTLESRTRLMMCGSYLLIEAVLKILFLWKKMKPTMILSMLMNLLAPVLNPIFLQFILLPVAADDHLGSAFKVLAGVNVFFVLQDGITFELLLLSFSLNPKNKLSKIKNNLISIRGVLVILLSTVLPLLNTRFLCILAQLLYFCLPLLTICKPFPIQIA